MYRVKPTGLPTACPWRAQEWHSHVPTQLRSGTSLVAPGRSESVRCVIGYRQLVGVYVPFPMKR